MGSSEVEKHSNMLVADYNGMMTWIPAVKYQSSCAVDMKYYPFDEQTCTMKFGPWVYDSQRLDVEFLDGENKFDTKEYVNNSEWNIVNNVAAKTVTKYPCCVNTYVDMQFNITLQRRVTFHMRLILVPTVLLSTMSAAIFWIPPHRPDRTSLGKTSSRSYIPWFIGLQV